MSIEQLAVVMPVYNEEEIVGEVLEKWVKMLDSAGISYCLHVYNDGSRDSTLEKLSFAAMRHPGRITLHDQANCGHGPTVLRGYREAAEAGYDWVFQVDSDDEIGPEKFVELWARRGTYDFLTGFRSGRKQSFPRWLVSGISRLTVRLFYGAGVRDVNSPYRLMRVAAFRDIYRRIPSGTLTPNVILSGMAAQEHLRCFELPVPQHNRTTGEVSIQKGKLLQVAVSSLVQTVDFAFTARSAYHYFLFCAVFSVAAKLLMAWRGWNYDFESYCLVAKIVGRGGNVYAETSRYNYGPVWCYVLWLLRAVSGSGFRYAVPLFLSLIDLGIAGLLWSRLNLRVPALLFLLSPLAIQISGYHRQMDNFAVLTALCAVCLLLPRGERERERRAQNEPDLGELAPSGRRTWGAALLLGFSLIVKHVFIFFPGWMLFRNYGFKKKCLLGLAPLVIFVLSFVPYVCPVRDVSVRTFREDCRFLWRQVKVLQEHHFHWTRAQQAEVVQYKNGRFRALAGVAGNVFFYRSYHNAILYRFFLPAAVSKVFSAWWLFIGGMILTGYWCRKLPLFDAFLAYTVLLVLLSSATTNQYLVIPLISACVYYFPFGIFYSLIPGIYLLCRPELTYSAVLYVVACALLLLIAGFAGRKKLAGILEAAAKLLKKC